MKKERLPPNGKKISVEISGNLASLITEGAKKSGLSPEKYVLSLLWHNVPLTQEKPSGLPNCVQYVLNDIQHYYPSIRWYLF